MNKIHFMLWAMILLTIFVISCKDDNDDDIIEEPHTCDAFHWGYEGEEKDWNSCFMECAGQVQSPVNITRAVQDANLSALKMNYTEVPVHLLNNGHTIQFEQEPGSTLELDGATFELLQFHFHTQSEHTIDGIRYPMEVHLVHKNLTTDALAVVGIMFKQGNENLFLKNFMENLPQEEDEHYMEETKKVNTIDLLPADAGYFTYSGSLTTPPCSQIVTWIVMKEPIEASPEQINSFFDLMQTNFRPIQPLNGREVKEFG